MRSLIGTTLLLLVGLAAQAADPADTAFDSGDYDRALALYDARLARDPSDVPALIRSGKLLSWRERYGEALERYERALALRPGDREAALERAKVLSWDGRYEASVDAFRAYLDDHPADRAARLGLASCLSWDRRFDESREQFAQVLEGDPHNLEALVGTARTWAWDRRWPEAEQWYEQALAVDPSNRDARVGLAHVYLWSGEVERARRAAAQLEREYPADGEIAALGRETRRAAAPRVRAEASRLEDTDDNELNILALGGQLGVMPGLVLDLDYSHYDMTNNQQQATIDSLFVTFGWRPTPLQRLSASIGVDLADNNINDRSETDALGGVDYLWGADRPWQFGGAVGRQALRYSPQITSNNVLYDYLTARANGKVAERWRVFADATAASLSDGNDRREFNTGFSYNWPLARPRLDVGYAFRYLDYSQNTDSGYFDPQGFVSNLANARVSGEFGTRRYTWSVALDTGLQSFTLNQVKADNDFVWIFNGLFGFPIGDAWALEAFGSWGDYAGLTAGGFESRTIGLRVRWRGGR